MAIERPAELASQGAVCRGPPSKYDTVAKARGRRSGLSRARAAAPSKTLRRPVIGPLLPFAPLLQRASCCVVGSGLLFRPMPRRHISPKLGVERQRRRHFAAQERDAACGHQPTFQSSQQMPTVDVGHAVLPRDRCAVIDPGFPSDMTETEPEIGTSSMPDRPSNTAPT
jgi:hypothetical protein